MVPGEGTQPNLAMVVGEAPGKKEVELGRPFVGQSGRLLGVALRACGIARADIYITNVVKELPLDSEERVRRPYPDEIMAWRPILDAEIQQTAPAAILALGRTAANVLTELDGDIPFGSRVGNVFVAWHPAYLLRNGGESQAIYGDWLEQIEPWSEAVRAAQ